MSEPSAVLPTVIASDNFLTREGLGCLLSGARGIEVVARVDSHPETLTAIRRYRPDVLIVGIRTPRVNAEAALSAAQQLRSQHPNIGVVVIAEAGDGYALELLRSGAAGVGYLLDDRVGDLETLLSAIHGAHAGDTVLDPSIVNALVRRRLSSALDVLSVRELNVLAEMACGYCNDEIARRLAVSKKAVEGHVTGIFRKLRVLLATSLYEHPSAGLHEDASASVREHPARVGCSILCRPRCRPVWAAARLPLSATRRAP